MKIIHIRRHNIMIVLTAFLVVSLCFLAAGKNAAAANINQIFVRLTYNERIYEYRFPDITYVGGADREIDKNFEKDFRGRIMRQKGELKCAYELKDARAKLNMIAYDIYKEPQNAEIVFSPDSKVKFDIQEDIKGKKLNVEAMLSKINNKLSKGESADLKIISDDIEAEITKASLMRSTAIRQEFSTDFTYSSPERKNNIELSLMQFNGLVIPPEGEVSFNQTVGERTEERGYKTAKIIVNGQFEEGIGGGVCQTSTTLYNAALLADLKILEQHRHTLAVSYVLPSFDAMVNISTADLRFKNESGNFIFIKTWVQNNRAYVRIYGEKLPYKIVRKSSIVKIHEKPKEKVVVDFEGKYQNIYEGERAIVINSKPRMESIGILEYYKDNVLIKSKIIRKDNYSQLIGTEIIGTRKREEVKTEAFDDASNHS